MNTLTARLWFGTDAGVELVAADVSPQRIALTYRKRSNMLLTCNPPVAASDSVWQEYYEPRKQDDGNWLIERCGGQLGVHVPAQTLPERFEFPSE